MVDAIVGRYRTPRVLGLDILRITAALTVIAHHGNTQALGNNVFVQLIWHRGYLAVDLFFVLSGWLLTRQLLGLLKARKTTRTVADFWLRRWARTLPSYWVVLGVIALLVALKIPALDVGGEVSPDLALGTFTKHALFLQTILPPNLYVVSWSLVTEEWFYFALPVFLVVLMWVRRPVVLVGVTTAILITPAVVRTAMLAHGVSWADIQAEPPARFEGLVVGASLAAISMQTAKWKALLRGGRIPIFVAGLSVVSFILLATHDDDWLFRTIGLLGFSLGLGCLLPFASSLTWPRQTPLVLVMSVSFLSELTYPLYLVHPLVLNRIHWLNASGTGKMVGFLLAAGLLLLAAAVLHLFVERPFIALRMKIVQRRRFLNAPPAFPVAAVQ